MGMTSRMILFCHLSDLLGWGKLQERVKINGIVGQQ